MKTIKIKCTRCIKAPIINLYNPIKLQDQHIEYCPNCFTELAFVEGDNLNRKYNVWTIRTNTAKLINN
jgi:Zn finger protein HypA/HybF involved in hydrogenase expression